MRALYWKTVAAASAFLAVAAGVAVAQQLPPSLTQQLLGRTQPGIGSSGMGNQDEATPPVILQPSNPRTSRLPPSRLESIMSNRAGVTLRQFGYSEVGQGRSILLPQQGGVQDGYILGPGDEIVISLRGQENSEFRTTVDSSGRVILPRLAPLLASGRTFGDFQRLASDAVRRAYVATEGYFSLGRIRQIRVAVSGEVNNPGVRVATGLTSVMDVLLISNGIKKTGSLRNIQIVRQGRRIRVDLYGVLNGRGTTSSLPLLTDGDQVVVPGLGPTVAITGLVRIPGIYELPAGRSGVSAQELINMAGGYEVRGVYKLSALRMQADGRSAMMQLGSPRELVSDGEILFANTSADQAVGRVTLSGSGTNLAGTYVSQNTRLSELMKAPGALGDNPYTLIGVISRRDQATLFRTLVGFSPATVLAGREDMALQTDDIVRVFSIAEYQDLMRILKRKKERKLRSDESMMWGRADLDIELEKERIQASSDKTKSSTGQNTNRNSAILQQESDGNFDDDAIGAAIGEDRSEAAAEELLESEADQLAQGGSAGMNEGQKIARRVSPENMTAQQRERLEERKKDIQAERFYRDLATNLKTDAETLDSFFSEHEVNISGAVRSPGTYLVGSAVDLRSAMLAAGGGSSLMDRGTAELISTKVNFQTGAAVTEKVQVPLSQASFTNYAVRPRDAVRFKEIFTDVTAGTITLQGEVRNPGSYTFVRGERLSEVLARAGGLSEVAYPYGAVFLRKSLALQERESFAREAREIENQMLIGMTRPDVQSKLQADAFAALQPFVQELKTQKPLGRLSILADPAILATKPEMDPLLEAGDFLFIPQRPSTVAVLGQVMRPTTLPADPDMSPSEYISKAGGYAQTADRSMTFIILPDGTARTADSSWFGIGGSSGIPPGSTIVVPRDVAPFDWRGFFVQSTAVLSQLAITAASLAVLSQNR